jgi:hypothetical protein
MVEPSQGSQGREGRQMTPWAIVTVIAAISLDLYTCVCDYKDSNRRAQTPVFLFSSLP